MFVVEHPRDEPADVECAVIFHDVPDFASVQAAMMGDSRAPMIDPMGSPEMRAMKPSDKMGDEVRYRAHCINGATYPKRKVCRSRWAIECACASSMPVQRKHVTCAWRGIACA